MRRSVFDDFIFYDRKNNEIWIGRRDIALNNVWRWCCYNGKKAKKNYLNIGLSLIVKMR